MAAPGLYFAIHYDVPDKAFYRAAMTWGEETLGGMSTAASPFLLEMVSTEADFRRAWKSIADQSQQLGMPVMQGHIFSHASKGGNEDGLEFRRGADGSEDTTLTQADIAALTKLNWSKEGLLTLAGCNSGLIGTRGWAPAGVFARNQKVKTVGQSGFAYFSQMKNTYVETNVGTQTMYLWAYKRKRNGWLGDGSRMTGVTFLP